MKLIWAKVRLEAEEPSTEVIPSPRRRAGVIPELSREELAMAILGANLGTGNRVICEGVLYQRVYYYGSNDMWVRVAADVLEIDEHHHTTQYPRTLRRLEDPDEQGIRRYTRELLKNHSAIQAAQAQGENLLFL